MVLNEVFVLSLIHETSLDSSTSMILMSVDEMPERCIPFYSIFCALLSTLASPYFTVVVTARAVVPTLPLPLDIDI
jgi:hypothetical protein